MARSPNRHEAETAKRMADSLMARHKLTKEDVAAFESTEMYERPMGAKGFEQFWKFSLVTATARFCGCEAISLQVGKRRKVRIVGERAKVDRAAELFLLLLRTLSDLEKTEAAWISDPSVLIYSQPHDYAVSFRQGATVAIIEMMQRLCPERFNLRRRKGASSSSSRSDSETRSPSSGKAATAPGPTYASGVTESRRGWFARFWEALRHPASESMPLLLALPNSDDAAPKDLVVVPSEAKKTRSEGDHKERLKAKYSPRQVKFCLEDAADDGAYWRGYEAARRVVSLTAEDAGTDGNES